MFLRPLIVRAPCCSIVWAGLIKILGYCYENFAWTCTGWKICATEAKVNSFAAGYGTILYFDDEALQKLFASNFPTYAANFKTWADQANGMLQFAIWTALEEEGLGANLQHYNPIIDAEVKEVFNIPDQYRLIAQMPFGAKTAEPDEKEVISGSDRMRILE